MSGEGARLIVFPVAGRSHALALQQAAEVLEGMPAHPVPGVPPFLDEAVNVHGRIVPVLDLAPFLGLGPRTAGGAIIVLDRQVAELALRGGGGVSILPADRVTGAAESDRPEIERYLLMARERVALLAVERLVGLVEEQLSNSMWRINGQDSDDRG
ncbi:chemotaxis protein CheW [Geobacter sp.]|uniref:chemotaxis protein CheW n=1 Tax=Geobacter sp. TaxID=46610 RepID=UPI00262B93FB|nr:chemotaxis protein CheW [Geobacter sp.]